MRCPYCDCPTENAGETIDTTTIDPSIQSAKSSGTTAIILGALGIFWAWFFAIIGWALGGAGLAVALKGRNKNKFEKTCQTGLIISAIALGCSFVSSLIGMLLMM